MQYTPVAFVHYFRLEAIYLDKNEKYLLAYANERMKGKSLDFKELSGSMSKMAFI